MQVMGIFRWNSSCFIPTDDEETNLIRFTCNKHFISQLIGKNNQSEYEHYFQSKRIVALWHWN